MFWKCCALWILMDPCNKCEGSIVGCWCQYSYPFNLNSHRKQTDNISILYLNHFIQLSNEICVAGNRYIIEQKQSLRFFFMKLLLNQKYISRCTCNVNKYILVCKSVFPIHLVIFLVAFAYLNFPKNGHLWTAIVYSFIKAVMSSLFHNIQISFSKFLLYS